MFKAKNLQFILQIGTILSLIMVFLVFSSFVFPFVTSKQIYFNFLISLMFPVWLLLIWRFKEYRPRKKFLAFSLISYLLAVLLSTIFSVDFNLSFWGDAERMLGWFHLIFYFLFYFYLISAWRSKNDWLIFLSTFVLVSVIIAILFLNDDNRIGNTAYLSGYLLFNIFLALILFIKIKSNWRYLWLVTLLPFLLAFIKAKTSGAIFGLGFAIFSFLFFYIFIAKKRIWKLFSLILIIVLLSSIILIFSQTDKDWFQNNRLLKGLTFDKPTFQTRLVSWEGAWREFPSNPIIGVGYGNYATIFDKQFDSRFLDYSRRETYFDRAHNNIIDITATTGLVGLITYLSIFLVLFVYLWNLYKKRKQRVIEGESINLLIEVLIIIVMFFAYLVQNLAVFDTQSTYLALMISLAYVTFLAENELNFKIKEPEKIKEKFNLKMKLGLSFVIILVLLSLSLNYRMASVFMQTVNSHVKIVQGQIELGLKEHKKAMSINSFNKRDSRLILINHFINNSDTFVQNLSTDSYEKELDYIISLAKENLSYNPKSSKNNLHLAQVFEAIARLSEDEKKKDKYFNKALLYINQAIIFSPGRMPLYLNRAQIYLGLNNYQSAKESVKKAISLNERLPDGYCSLAQIEIALTNQKEALKYLDECLNRQGINYVSLDQLLILALEGYKEEGDYQKVLIILNRLNDLRPNDLAVYYELTKTYLYLDNKERAIRAGEKLTELSPDINESAQLFISIANDKISNDKIELAVLAAEIATELDESLKEALDEFMHELERAGVID